MLYWNDSSLSTPLQGIKRSDNDQKPNVDIQLQMKNDVRR